MSQFGFLKRLWQFIVLVFFVFPLVTFLQPAQVAYAATITVNTTDDTGADDGLCSLREAIEAANTDTKASTGDCMKGYGADVITFIPDLDYIHLSGNLPDVTKPITFVGKPSVWTAYGVSSVDGGSSYRSGFVIDNTNVKIINMAFENGSAMFGGAIQQTGVGTIVISKSRFRFNSASFSGGALFLNDVPSLSVASSSFDSNTAILNGGAIAIASDISALKLTNTYVTGNTAGADGGAIYLTSNVLNGINIVGGGYESNTATNGGVLFANADVRNIIVNVPAPSMVFNNHAGNSGGVFYINGKLTGGVKFAGTRFQDNSSPQQGGMLAAPNSTSLFNVSITGSTFDNNDASQGGVLYTDGRVGGLSTYKSHFMNGDTVLEGGVFRMNSLGIFSSTLSEFNWNTSGTNGGVLYTNFLTGAIKIIQQSRFESNSAASDGGAIYIDDPSGATLIQFSASHFLSNTSTNGDGGVLFVPDFAGKVAISGSEFTGNTAAKNGGAILLSNPNMLALNIGSSTFTGNIATGYTPLGDPPNGFGGVIALRGVVGTVTISGSKFFSNTARLSGGAVAIRQVTGVVSIVNGSLFDGNLSTFGFGGAVYVDNTGGLKVGSSTFQNNTAGSGGGAFTFYSGGPAYISGSKFIGNAASGQNSEGGALDISSQGPTYISGSKFIGNAANTQSGRGGAFHVWAANHPVTITGSTFDSNVARDGGALYTDSAITTIASSVFKNNQADSGGAAYITTQSTLQTTKITGTTFTSNVATSYGGALVLWGSIIPLPGPVTITSSTFRFNSAVLNGGGIFAGYDSKLTITGSRFQQNDVSAGNGGGLYVTTTLLTMSKTLFAANTASGTGDAVYFNTGAFHYNCFQGNGTDAVYDATGGLDVTLNWWGIGGVNPPGSGDTYGSAGAMNALPDLASRPSCPSPLP